MNKRVLFGATMLVACSSFAQITESQSAKIIWGDEIKESKKLSLSHVIGADSDFFYGLVTKRGSFSLDTKEMSFQRFTQNMEVVNRVEIDFKTNGVEREYSDVLMVGGKIHLFTTFKNDKLNEKILFAQEIDKNSLLPIGALKPLVSASIKNQADLFKGLSRRLSGTRFWNYVTKDILVRSALNTNQFFGIKLSQDSTKSIVVYKVLDPNDKTEIIGISVFDPDFNLIWSKNVNIAFPDKEFIAQDYEVDKEGNAYILGRLYDGKVKERVKGEVNYKYMLLCYNSNGEKINQFSIDINNRFIKDMKLMINNSKQLMVAGFYANDLNAGLQGSFYKRINLESGEVEVSNTQDFTMDLITENLSDRGSKRAEKKAANGKEVGLDNYVLDAIYLKSDGTLALVAEQFDFYVSTTSNSNGGSYSTTIYYYDNILVLNIEKDSGEILWAKKINKHQRTSSDVGKYSSYALAVVKDKMYFVFNDNVKNYAPGESERAYAFNKGNYTVTTVAEMDPTGQCSYNVLFVGKDEGVYCIPTVSQQVTADELMIYNSGGRKQRFAKIKFN